MVGDVKSIYITGGCGYVGSRTAEVLVKKGYGVVVVDIATPQERGLSFSEGIEFRQADLRIEREARQALQGAEFILHLAADIGSLTYMHDHQAEILTNNSLIDAVVYPLCVELGVRWTVYSSSSGIFQHPPKFPYTEFDAKKINPPTNPYFFSKLAGEYFCRSYFEQYGIPFTILRYHNIYGPGEDAKGSTPGDIHVIPALLDKVIGGQYPLEFLGDPSSTRPFTFVDDAVVATVEVVERALVEDETVWCEDFNVGNDKYLTILELGEKIWERYGDERPFEYTIKETRANTAHRREVDIKKIREVIGWEPTTSFEDGLEMTAQWIKNRGKNSGSLWK